MTAIASPSRRRGAALEDAILGAAWDELSEIGYAAFTVESVAARARTGKASIYRRWPTRSDLILDAMCARMPTPEACGLEMQFPDEVTTFDALRGIAGVITEVMASPAGEVMRTIKCEAQNDAELARAIDERFAAPRREALQALLRRGIERGEVRPGADDPLIADLLPAMFMHRVIMLGETLTPQDVSDIIEKVLIPLVEVR